MIFEFLKKNLHFYREKLHFRGLEFVFLEENKYIYKNAHNFWTSGRILMQFFSKWPGVVPLFYNGDFICVPLLQDLYR